MPYSAGLPAVDRYPLIDFSMAQMPGDQAHSGWLPSQ